MLLPDNGLAPPESVEFLFLRPSQPGVVGYYIMDCNRNNLISPLLPNL